MHTKRSFSKILAFMLCLQLLLSNFGQTGIVYAAEQDNSETVLAEETSTNETPAEKAKDPEPAEEAPAEEKTAAVSKEEAEQVTEKKAAAETPPETTTAETPVEEPKAPETAASDETASAAEETSKEQESSSQYEIEESKVQPGEETSSQQDETKEPESSSENVESNEDEETSSAGKAEETPEEAEKTAETTEEASEETEETTEATEETSEETEETTETKEETWNDTPITGRATKEGVTIIVSAPEGSFPEGTTLQLEKIGASQTEEIIHSVNNGQEAVAFDISFFSSDGKKVQPRDGYLVDVRFEIDVDSVLADPDGNGATLHAYHVADNGSIEALGSVDAPENEEAQLQIWADNFSPYVLVKNTPEETSKRNRDASTSSNLADFLVNVTCDAPTDENGNYVINPNDSYEITFSFRENENIQFDNEADLIYVLPDGLLVSDVSATSFDIRIGDSEGTATISNNTFEVVDGKLIVRFNQSDPNIERLKALANVSFQVELTVQIDENAGSIVFNSDIEKEFVFETNSDLTIDKTVVYDMDSNTANYELKVISYGTNDNVVIEDHLTGTALVFNQDVTAESSINGGLSVTPDYTSVDNGFRVAIPQMANGEVITLRYSATVDNAKISSNGTVEQTNNTARVTSDQVPDGKEASANFAGQADFQRVAKRPVGEPSQIAENLYTQEWKIRVNEDHKLPMGDADISDWIVQNSRPFMQFDGEGLSVVVTFEDGSTETRVVPWSELYVWEGSTGKWGWRYHTPETDGNASYEITCTTLINTNGALGDLSLVNGAQVYGSYDEGTTTIGVIGENEFDIQKDALGTTSTESEWAITVTVPGSGLDEMHVVDDAPKLTYEGQSYIDYPLEDSFGVEGLLEGESWRFHQTSDRRSFTVTFYKSGTQNEANKGLLPTPDGQPRNIVIRYRTQVNQDWLHLASEDGYASSTLHRHRNYASAWGNFYRTPTVDASVFPIMPEMVKDFVERSSVEIDGVTYPVFRYSLTLLGPVSDGVVIHDSFPVEYLKFYEAAGIQIRGWSNSTPANENGTASVIDTSDGFDITVGSFPKQADGSFYSYYLISYSLIAKDQNGLSALNEAAASSSGGVNLENTARWDNLESSSSANYTYFPYVDKDLVSQASPENDYVAEFKLIINPYADDLDPESDTLNIQDELSANLRFIQDSITVSPEADGVRAQYDGETNTITFTGVPDNTRFEITYRARVLGKGNVTYSNTVKFGKYEKTVEDEVKIESGGSGSGSNPSITLVKRDAENVSNTLAGATFQLFFIRDGAQVPVTDRNGNNVTFTTGANGSVLIAGNQSALGWTLWEGRTYQLIELSAPAGYELNNTPTEFILSEAPSSQMEYDITGDSVTAWDTKTKTEISVKKEWVGPAAESITVYLKAGDDTVKTAMLNEGNNWQYTFGGIDKYDANGEEIQYRVEEAPLDGYSIAITGNMSDGYVIKNTNTDTVDIPVKKEWIGAPADRIIVNLLADKEPVDEAELSVDSGWEHVFAGLPKYDANDGHEISYNVEEERLEGYSSQYSGNVVDGIIITNTNTETLEIPVKKVWIGPAPEKLTVILFADGEEMESIELKEENEWSYSFTRLNRYDPTDGHEIEYSVEEENLPNYRSEKDGSIQNGITFTNINTETIDIPVEKKWVGPAEESIIIKLFADGIELDAATLSEETSWKHTFTELPKYDSGDGHAIQYDIREDPLEGYEPHYQADEEQGYIITNTITGKVSVPVSKVWIGPATESIIVNLLADNTKVAEAELNEENGWKHTFENLEKYNNGKEISYTVEEIKMDDYVSEITGDQEQGYTITNINTEKTEVSVTKQWIGTPADAVTINLLADEEILETIELTAETEWKHSFTNLPKYSAEDGHKIAYSVREDPLEGYIPGYSGTEETGYTITNTITGKVSVPVTKTWVGPAADSVTVELLADGTKVAEAELNAENSWQYTFTDLEQYKDGKEIKYEIAEMKIEGYSSEITGGPEGYTVKNTNTSTINIPVRKVWIGPAAESVTIRLFSDGIETEMVSLTEDNDWKYEFMDLPKYDPVDGHEIGYDIQEDVIPGYDPKVVDLFTEGVIFTNTNTETLNIPVEKRWIGPAAEEVTIRLMADGAEKESVVLSEATGWTHTFADLRKYDADDGHEIDYLLKEDVISGYESATSGTITEGITFTNTNTETIDIPVEKKWVGEEAGPVTIRLLADGNEVDSIVLTGETNWKHTFTGLLKYDGSDGHEIEYSVKEDPVENYITGISGTAGTGFTVTNTITGKASVPVTKTWIGPSADKVTINLLADGVKVDAVQLSAMNSWQHTFEDLDKYKDGIEIKYTVEEEKLDNYLNETSGNASDGYIIQNTNTEKLDIPVLKVWVGKAAKQVTIRLMADGIETSSAVLTEESNWKHTFKDLPKYDDKDGHEIKYTVTEDAIEGYNTSISGSENEGFTITNSIEGKVSFSVSKKWIGPSADSVTIYLLADGEILQEVKLNSTNSWKYMFTGLEQYKDGVEIKYTIKEKELSGYAISITGSVETGFTVTNVNVKTMNIPIEKKWVGSEGGSVTIRLYADGIEIDKLKLTKSEGWKSKFSDLPIYDAEDGHEIKYTILEDDIEGYTSKISGSAGNGYTVTNTKKETPETDPKKPTTPTTRSSDTPKTGDESNIALWTLILLISGGLLLFLFFRKRKNSETE